MADQEIIELLLYHLMEDCSSIFCVFWKCGRILL